MSFRKAERDDWDTQKWENVTLCCKELKAEITEFICLNLNREVFPRRQQKKSRKDRFSFLVKK